MQHRRRTGAARLPRPLPLLGIDDDDAEGAGVVAHRPRAVQRVVDRRLDGDDGDDGVRLLLRGDPRRRQRGQRHAGLTRRRRLQHDRLQR